MRQTCKIRPATAEDLQEVGRLLSECQLPAEGLEDQFGDAYCVLRCDGQIVGAGGVEEYGRYGLLRSVAVSPKSQGKSLGRAVVEDRLAWAKSRGLSAVFLLATDAAGYFERFGFSSIGRDAVPSEIKNSAEFSSVCPQSATVMVKPLCDSTSNS